ncbi:topoisomerase II [Artemisia annua]|uniref:DNA topoisomerase 2 n=1 Tax=Artemisia annua TaxID=35608 RepID=A0A2U1PSM5_ARTAN|nr:topoisomerase II [Artemisia annua]
MATSLQSTTAQNDSSVERHQKTQWIWKNEEMIKKTITFIPGLYRMFDEVLVTAAGNKQEDCCVKVIKVGIDVSNSMISVWYNGILSYDYGHWYDEENNMFSTEFTIKIADGGRIHERVFTNNMKTYHETIEECKSSEKWTMFSFKPDLAKYGMECLEDDTVSLMKRRVVDLAGCLANRGEVELDGTRLPIKTFEDYVKLYPGTSKRIYEKVNEKWDICVCLSDGQFEQVSFLNYTATLNGGSHVDYITSQITRHLQKIVVFEPNNIKSYLWVFVNALIDNPAFDSQTEENLTTTDKGIFGCELTHEFLKRIAIPYLGKRLVLHADNLDNQKEKLKKIDRIKTWKLGIPILEDAKMAATDKSRECTLILTQGDSAKAFAMSGLSVVGQDYYGVFPLKGELLNVREATHQKLRENTEIRKIKKILGLQDGKVYKNVEELRYGHLMVMADKDHDGTLIKGLLIYILQTYWPSLLKVPHFLRSFITPVLMVSNYKKATDVEWFYTMDEYVNWKKNMGKKAKKYKIKYFKGLKTTKYEGAEYFGFGHHIQEFVGFDNEDHDAIELAFSKMKIEARMKWLQAPQAGTCTDSKEKSIRYCDFINKEFKQCLVADLRRSIPSMVDGLRCGQRKILFCAFKKPIIQEIQVAQFSHYVSEHSAYHHDEHSAYHHDELSAYHHDEASLVGTIIGMAQNYVGSNNINLLQPIGQFGTRHMGGKDHADGRCTYTRLSPITRYLFPKDDELILHYLNDDVGNLWEQVRSRGIPLLFMPSIPMVLVNGSELTGIGWSSFIPNYNPRDIIANLKRLLRGEAMVAMDPWYKGFKGDITVPASKDTGYTTIGKMQEIEDGIRITELPVGRWTREYKEFLKAARYGKDRERIELLNGNPMLFLQAYTAHKDKTIVDFKISMSEDQMNTAKKEGISKKFKLTTTLSTANMYLFDVGGAIKKYDTPEQIHILSVYTVLQDFFPLRLDFYEKRRIALLDELKKAILQLENKMKFIGEFLEGSNATLNREDNMIYADLKAKGYTYLPKETEPTIAGREEYGYLLSVNLLMLCNAL